MSSSFDSRSIYRTLGQLPYWFNLRRNTTHMLDGNNLSCGLLYSLVNNTKASTCEEL